jgi:serine/threonine-protein kinase RsbW
LEPIEDRPNLRLDFESRPETVTLVRGALEGMAEALSLDPELLDDMKTAISEACNNVMLHAYGGACGPLLVLVYLLPGTVEVIVRDGGGGIPSAAPVDDRLQGVGLPVIRALAQRAEFRSLPAEGTEVWMTFAGRRGGETLFEMPDSAAPDDGWVRRMTGDAVVSVSPVSLVGGVLGRVTRALAAKALFSLDRISDAFLVTDAIAAHANRACSSPRIEFSVSTGVRRVELRIGPLRAGVNAQLCAPSAPEDARSALTILVDELKLVPLDGEEMLCVVMVDRTGGSRPPSA